MSEYKQICSKCGRELKPHTYFCGRLYYACVNKSCENYFDRGVYDRHGRKIADSSDRRL